MTPADLFQFVKGLTVDPDFPAFVDLCQEHGAGVTVVSDGMDFLVASTLRRAGLDIPFYANELEWQGGDRWKLRFPHLREDCRWNMGNCKCGHLSSPSEGLRIMVGDGRSDFCIAEACDYTLAKGALAVHCRENNLPYTGIANFAEAIDALTRWLSDRSAGVRRPAAQVLTRAAR